MSSPDLTVRGFDGTPLQRDADLHNRNLWEVSEENRVASRGGQELQARRNDRRSAAHR